MSANIINKPGRPANDKPRTRRNGGPIPPVWAGQVTFDEHKALTAVHEKTGRTKSEIVRRALQRLLKDHKAERIDWAKSAD